MGEEAEVEEEEEEEEEARLVLLLVLIGSVDEDVDDGAVGGRVACSMLAGFVLVDGPTSNACC